MFNAFLLLKQSNTAILKVFFDLIDLNTTKYGGIYLADKFLIQLHILDFKLEFVNGFCFIVNYIFI